MGLTYSILENVPKEAIAKSFEDPGTNAQDWAVLIPGMGVSRERGWARPSARFVYLSVEEKFL